MNVAKTLLKVNEKNGNMDIAFNKIDFSYIFLEK